MAAGFSFSFTWDGLRPCTSGNPNIVSNPQFIVAGLPAGTETITFLMTDLDVPSYNHGGGSVKMNRDGKVPANAFRYKSPCPPNGSHTYQWTATANSASGKALAVATARKQYP